MSAIRTDSYWIAKHYVYLQHLPVSNATYLRCHNSRYVLACERNVVWSHTIQITYQLPTSRVSERRLSQGKIVYLCARECCCSIGNRDRHKRVLCAVSDKFNGAVAA